MQFSQSTTAAAPSPSFAPADNQHEPKRKRAALAEIFADYNTRFGTNHRLDDFYGYYRDVQKRIKSHRLPNSDLPRAKKIDIVSFRQRCTDSEAVSLCDPVMPVLDSLAG